jgi:hypothetical protein
LCSSCTDRSRTISSSYYTSSSASRARSDIAGRSLGRYQLTERLVNKRELMGENISFFDL